MWLLHTKTYELKLFVTIKPGTYAILSHRWEDDEVDFADLKDRSRLSVEQKTTWAPKSGREESWKKIQRACQLAREENHEWIWLDMCCIDKTSSAELQEALNSMFALYRDASVCFAYLKDVPAGDLKIDGSEFRESVWFKRGWTLQELIAPAAERLVFLYKDWTLIGTRAELAATVAEITNIDRTLLEAKSDDPKRLDFSRFSVAARMSWASNRTTTRPEDQAYSLAGLFGVSMSIVYGEGGENAFWRLQLEIILQSPDQSIFASASSIGLHYVPPSLVSTSSLHTYDSMADASPRNLLASSPRDFLGCSDIIAAPGHSLTTDLGLQPLTEPHFYRTNFGIRVQLPLLPTREPNVLLGALACQDGPFWRALALRQIEGDQVYVPIDWPDTGPELLRVIDLPFRTPGDLASSTTDPYAWRVETIYIHWKSADHTSRGQPGEWTSIPFSIWQDRGPGTETAHSPSPGPQDAPLTSPVDDGGRAWLQVYKDALSTFPAYNTPAEELGSAVICVHEAMSAALDVFVSRWPAHVDIRTAYEQARSAATTEKPPFLHETVMFLQLAHALLILHFCWLQELSAGHSPHSTETRSSDNEGQSGELLREVADKVVPLGSLIEICTAENWQGFSARREEWKVDTRLSESVRETRSAVCKRND